MLSAVVLARFPGSGLRKVKKQPESLAGWAIGNRHRGREGKQTGRLSRPGQQHDQLSRPQADSGTRPVQRWGLPPWLLPMAFCPWLLGCGVSLVVRPDPAQTWAPTVHSLRTSRAPTGERRQRRGMCVRKYMCVHLPPANTTPALRR